MKILFFYILTLSLNVLADVTSPDLLPKSPEDDSSKIYEYQERCKNIRDFYVKNKFPISCNGNYQYYGAINNFKAIPPKQNDLKIAGYNILHPGSAKSLFKDYELMAKIMNKYDVIGSTEILATVGHDEVVNQNALSYLKETNDQKTVMEVYRTPGYIKLLEELKKLDSSWSLILSPRGDSALDGSQEEMVGFFFRSSKVTLDTNPHCNEFNQIKNVPLVACFAEMNSKFMDKDYLQYFSRRPFLASFKTGSFKFTLIASHVVFNFSGSDEFLKKMTKDVFGVDDLYKIGDGVSLENVARFAEVKMTIDFMGRYTEKYKAKNLIYSGDTNLAPNIPYWEKILAKMPGAKLLVQGATTVSPGKFRGDGSETNALASSYDHFVLDKNVFSSCDNGQVDYYFNGDIHEMIKKKYLIRDQSIKLSNEDQNNFDEERSQDPSTPEKYDYPLTAEGKLKMESLAKELQNSLESMYLIKNKQKVKDEFQIEERVDAFKRRVFLNQLTNSFYYRFYQEILSDHYPVYINCKI